jgi:aspartyl-tRNA(Asn)/glutamyl-tRNA(Gln) amidotransferase subunit C
LSLEGEDAGEGARTRSVRAGEGSEARENDLALAIAGPDGYLRRGEIQQSLRLGPMAIDRSTVLKIATLARIRVPEQELDHLVGELQGIVQWVEQLNEVDVSEVEPMTSVRPMALKRRRDEVTDGGMREKILANAPETAAGFFVVPKVIE